MRQRDIPAKEALREAVKLITSAESLEQMRSLTERVYIDSKMARSSSRTSMIQAFINFVLRGYLQNPQVDPRDDIFLQKYSSEFHSVKHRLRQLGVLPPKP